jgi:hypothetical protein
MRPWAIMKTKAYPMFPAAPVTVTLIGVLTACCGWKCLPIAESLLAEIIKIFISKLNHVIKNKSINNFKHVID